jgi:glycosyltransferase involved in cell wall biosynthesis
VGSTSGAARSLHVLFVSDTWGLIGGTERYASVVVPELQARGHRVTVLCREDKDGGASPFQVEVLERPELEGRTLLRWQRRELRALLERLAPDVIFHSALRNVDGAELLCQVAPVVRYVHDHTMFCPGLNKYREDGATCREPLGRVCLERYYLKDGCICFKRSAFPDDGAALTRFLDTYREIEVAQLARTVLTNSHYMREQLLQVGFHPDQTSVLYYFTRSNTPDQPQGDLPPATQVFLDTSDAPLLFTPARLTLPDKGVDYLITALGALQRPFRAVVAGSGPAEDWLRAKARDEGLDGRLHFTGWMDSPGVERLFALASVVVCPSVWDEPFGLVGIEAMTHRKPVVAFRVGGIPEWCRDGETGILVERQDSAGLAAAIERLLADPELARKMGAQGHAFQEEGFPRDRHVRELEGALLAAAG